jgi:hypothetical protein
MILLNKSQPLAGDWSFRRYAPPACNQRQGNYRRGRVSVGSGVSPDYIHKKGEAAMSGSGKKDKGKKQPKKKPEHSLKEKRKLKNEKKHKDKFMPV